jgi:peroxiredoxin
MRQLLTSFVLLALGAFGWPQTRLSHAMNIPSSIQGKNLADATSIALDPRDGTKLTVVAFLSARCPCSASHEATLAALAKEFGSEARFVGIHSNVDEPETESSEHFKKSALPFPVIQDSGSRLANEFGAVKTPHVFVLAKSGEVLFQGGVDDSHDAHRASREYLKNALQDLRAGRAPQINLARSIGCIIRR